MLELICKKAVTYGLLSSDIGQLVKVYFMHYHLIDNVKDFCAIGMEPHNLLNYVNRANVQAFLKSLFNETPHQTSGQ